MVEKNKKEKGFTLIEIIVTMFIFTVLVFGIGIMLNNIYVQSNQQLTSMGNIDQSRQVLSVFTNEIRDATTGSDGSYPLNEASSSEIIFFSNYKIANSKIARIRYYISGNTLYKGIVLPTGSPATYNLSSEVKTSVATNLSSPNSTIFYYYDGNYAGNTNALSQPVNINQVRYVKISLSVLNQISPQNTSAFSISAGSAIRSIKDNLGN